MGPPGPRPGYRARQFIRGASVVRQAVEDQGRGRGREGEKGPCPVQSSPVLEIGRKQLLVSSTYSFQVNGFRIRFVAISSAADLGHRRQAFELGRFMSHDTPVSVIHGYRGRERALCHRCVLLANTLAS